MLTYCRRAHCAFLLLALLGTSACQRPDAAARAVQKAPGAPEAPGAAGVFADEKIMVGKQERQYRLIVPRSVDLTMPAPLVVAFHGILIDSKDLMPLYTRLDVLAADKKFLLVFPEAIGKSWGIAPDKVQADLACFDAVVADVRRRYRVNPDRIYVLGMSNGGYFAHLVGKERSSTVAAVCAHSGPLGLQTLFGIGAERKFPVMIVHGDQDNIFPVAWARENRDKYLREKHAVTYVEVPGLTHQWASQAGINEILWEFFDAHPLK